MKRLLPAVLAGILACAISITPSSAAGISWKGDDLYIHGHIGAGDASSLLATVDANRPGLIHKIYIKSPGGDSIGSLKLAMAVRKLGLPLYVEGQCNSGCAYVYLAAKFAYTDVPVLAHGAGGDDDAKASFLAKLKPFLADIGYSRYFERIEEQTLGGPNPTFAVKR